MEQPLQRRLHATRRGLAILAGLSVGLVGAVLALLFERGPEDPRALVKLAMKDPEIRRAAIDRLVKEGSEVWDVFPDPEVGRVMQPNLLDRRFQGTLVSSNVFGLREKSFAPAKPAGVTRVVLLGDSYVFGYGVEPEERLGAFLERYLEEQSGAQAESIECLHVAIGSWNIRAECAYVRRQISALRPDLVVQVVIVNDLDDLSGARSGGTGLYSPQAPERVNGVVSQTIYPPLWPREGDTYLLYGLDHESRRRYAEACREIARLASTVEPEGRYLLLGVWMDFNPMIQKHLAAALDDSEIAYVSTEFCRDSRFILSAENEHWNRAGHDRIAKLIYGLVVERGLLQSLSLPRWDEAAREVEEIHGRGLAEAREFEAFETALRRKAEIALSSSFDLAELSEASAKQVHGGIDSAGNVAPYASLVLARRGGERLELRGERYETPELDSAAVAVYVEEFFLDRIPLAGTEDIELGWELPDEVRERPFLNVRFEASDYVYTDLTLGRAGSFVLHRLAIE